MKPMTQLKHTSLILKITALIVGATAVAFCLAWLMLKGGMSGWISLPLVLVLFLVVGFLFSRKLISPLTQMRDAAEAMAQGDYDVRVSTSSHDEIGQLATSFNVMAGELEHADQMRRDLIANVSQPRGHSRANAPPQRPHRLPSRPLPHGSGRGEPRDQHLRLPRIHRGHLGAAGDRGCRAQP
jgi:methyl-accepting chemotaxis protein